MGNHVVAMDDVKFWVENEGNNRQRGPWVLGKDFVPKNKQLQWVVSRSPVEADAEAIRAAVLLDEIMQAAPEHSTARIVVVRLPLAQAHMSSACYAALVQIGPAKLTLASKPFLWGHRYFFPASVSVSMKAIAPAPFLQGMSCSQMRHFHLQAVSCKWDIRMASSKLDTSSDLLSHRTPTPDSMLFALSQWSACKLKPAGEPCARRTEPLLCAHPSVQLELIAHLWVRCCGRR